MKKRYVIFILILCMSIIFSGCSNENSNIKEEQSLNDEFTFTEENFNEFLIKCGDRIKKDFANGVDSFDVDSKDLGKIPLIREFRFYNQQDLTEKQREQLDIVTTLESRYSLYVKVGEDSIEENLIDAIEKYREKINPEFTLFDDENTTEEDNTANSLKFEDTKLETRGDYIYYTGYVKNVGNRSYTYIKVKAVYYDEGGNILDTDWTYAVSSEGLAPNERKSFKIMTRYTESITQGSLSILGYK